MAHSAWSWQRSVRMVPGSAMVVPDKPLRSPTPLGSIPAPDFSMWRLLGASATRMTSHLPASLRVHAKLVRA